MQITDMPPVFRNFAAVPDKAPASVAADNIDNSNDKKEAKKAKSKTDVELCSAKNKHPMLKTTAIIAGSVAAFAYGIPALRKGIFGTLDPRTIKLDTKSGLAKKGFIEFADQIKAKRNLTGSYFKGRLLKAKEIVRRNFFSYNQEVPENLTPVKKWPKKFVTGVKNEFGELKKYVKTMFSHIKIVYEEAAKNK